jgi:threonine dehydratase
MIEPRDVELRDVVLRDVELAAKRIAGRIRRTPLFRPAPITAALSEHLTLKLEALQVSGSFKARGALNRILSLETDARERGLVTASGGNHGAAVAYAGQALGMTAVVVVPHGVDPRKAERIRRYGAELVLHGEVWDESDGRAREIAAEHGLTYVHPFADAAVIAGQGTVALELLQQGPETDTILVAVGGGGLIAGIAVAAKAIKPSIRIVGIEPVGCPALKLSLEAGRRMTVERVTTKVATLAARRVGELNFELCRRRIETVALVDDAAMREAARVLWREAGIAADLSGAAATAALLTGAYRPEPEERVCALVCGAGADGID